MHVLEFGESRLLFLRELRKCLVIGAHIPKIIIVVLEIYRKNTEQ